MKSLYLGRQLNVMLFMLIVFSCCELNIGLVCACMPAMPAFFRRMKQSLATLVDSQDRRASYPIPTHIYLPLKLPTVTQGCSIIRKVSGIWYIIKINLRNAFIRLLSQWPAFLAFHLTYYGIIETISSHDPRTLNLHVLFFLFLLFFSDVNQDLSIIYYNDILLSWTRCQPLQCMFDPTTFSTLLW